MKEKEKKQRKWPIVALFLILLLLIGSTFAWFSMQLKGENVNVLKAGTLSLILDETTSDGILLENAIPMSYQQGIETTEYTFTLKNEGVNSDYTIYLDDEALEDGQERIEDSKIRYILLKDGETASADKSQLLSTLTDRAIDLGTIEKDQEITYSVRIWIDSKAGDTDINEVNGKYFYAKLRVEAAQSNNGSSSNIYSDGYAVYFNPETATKCDESSAISTPGTKTGCMKWYIFNDVESSDTVNMILDHNTNQDVDFSVSALETDTSTWKSELLPRYITANEIAEITKATEALTWNSTTATVDNWFYLNGSLGTDSIWQTEISDIENTSYSWLYDNMETSGYWTDTGVLDTDGTYWYVDINAKLYYVVANRWQDAGGIWYQVAIGIRPVITVPKTSIS